MPVEGLPSALETTMEALMKDNKLCSWQIKGDDYGTQVIVRFSPAAMTDGTPMLDYAYRRLSPSQMSRDRTRMSKYRDRLRNGSYLSDNAHLMNNRIGTTNDIVNNNTGNQQDIQSDI